MTTMPLHLETPNASDAGLLAGERSGPSRGSRSLEVPILMTVATALPGVAQTLAASVRDLAFAGTGVALLWHCRTHRVLPRAAA